MLATMNRLFQDKQRKAMKWRRGQRSERKKRTERLMTIKDAHLLSNEMLRKKLLVALSVFTFAVVY